MSRPLRIEFPGAYYHLMNRGLAHQAVFTNASDRNGFLELLADCHQMWGIRVIAYCLMDNHYHLLIQTPEPNLSRVMRHLDGVYTQRYNRWHKRDGPLFRGRYKAIVVEADEYLLAVARYIHYNPVAAGLVRFPEQYEWSSCQIYLWKGKKRPEWLDANQLLDRFPKAGRQAEFLAFMRSKVEESGKPVYEGQQSAPLLGTKPFIEGLRKLLQERMASFKEVPEANRYVYSELETCLKVVGEVYGMKRGELLTSRRGRRNEARAMAIYMGRKMAGMKYEEIARVFKVSGYSAVSSVVGRMGVELKRGGNILQRYNQIRDLLQN